MVKRKKTPAEALCDQVLEAVEEHEQSRLPEDVEFDSVKVVDEDFGEPSTKKARGENVTSRLRQRGSLAAALSSGKYSAAPLSSTSADAATLDEPGSEKVVSAANVEQKMDDIFDLLDESDGDGEVAEREGSEATDEEDEHGRAHQKVAALSGRNAQKQSNKELAARIAKATRTEADDATNTADQAESDEAVLSQIAKLKEIQVLASTGGAREEADDTSRSSSNEAAARLIEVYCQLIRLRVRMQPCVLASVSLPRPESRQLFAQNDSVTSTAYASAAAELRALIHSLLLSASAKALPAATDSEDLWKAVSEVHASAMDLAKSSIAHWDSTMSRPFSMKLKALHQPILEQIENLVSASARLLPKVQRNRTHVHVLGRYDRMHETPNEKGQRLADGDLDEEVYDDSDLLRELIHRCAAWSSMTSKALESDADAAKAAEYARTAGSKRQHYKLTKGRTINFDARPKLVGFLAAEPFEASDRRDAILASIFAS